MSRRRTPPNVFATRERNRLLKEEAQKRAREEAVALMERTEETVALAEARGEEVHRGARGQVSVTSRDPLLSLLRGGRLTHDQFDAGAKVKEMYERRFASLGSQMDGLGAASSPTYDNTKTVLEGIQRAKALQKIGQIEREVAIQCAQEPVALQMLRWVCEQGHSIRSASGGGRTHERYVRALAMALDVADSVIGGGKAR